MVVWDGGINGKEQKSLILYEVRYIMLSRKRRNRAVMVVSIVLTFALAALWFSPVVNGSNTMQTATSPSASAQQIHIIKSGYNIISNGPDHIFDIRVNYSVDGNLGINLGNNVTIVSQAGIVQVNVSGNTISLFATFNAIPVNGSTTLGTDPIFNKSGPGYGAILDNYQVSVSSFPSAADFVAIFTLEIGNVEAGALAGNPSAAFFLGAAGAILVTALAADLLYLYADAAATGNPSFYVDFGMSWGTGLFNFFGNLGLYGEEGLYSGAYDTYNALYIPVLIVGGHSNALANGEIPHTGVWNPLDEPPW